MTPKQCLLANLSGRPADRPAVLCPGGMMSMAVTEVMESSGAAWPEAHTDAGKMLALGLAMQEATGFDSIALPFCMTVEAEAYGAAVFMGDATSQPRPRGFLLPSDGSGELARPDFRAGRAAVVLEALANARTVRPDVALVGNLVGPVSLLGQLCDPLMMLRWMRRRPDLVRRYLERLADDLANFGLLQVTAGCDAVCIAEPTGTGEILGGPLFREHALPHLNHIADRLRDVGAKVIVHICGNVRAIEAELRGLHADAVSVDSVVDILAFASGCPPWQVMGNVSPFLLKDGPPEKIAKRCRTLIGGGVRLLAPACGVIATTPAANLRAMRRAADA
jgi:[methyl-Co(III) methanol-specific corrinoid protein]:coenzyme M methyltransferase